MPVSDDAPSPSLNEKIRWRPTIGIRRVVVVTTAFGMIAGVGLLTAGFAMAANGTEPGHLTLTPASGAVTATPAAATTDACPTGFQASAQLAEFNTDGSFASSISKVNNAPTSSTGFSLTLISNVGDLLATTTITNGASVEWAVGCYNQTAGTGSVKYVQSTMVTLSSDGKLYTTNGQFTTPSPSASPTSSRTSSPSSSPTSSPTDSPTSTPTTTSTSSPSPSSTLPSGGPQTGYGGTARPSGGSGLLIALGAFATAGSAVAMGVAIRRPRKLAQENGPGDGGSGES